MFKINRLRLEIQTVTHSSDDTTYGFDIPMYKGLNIIAGRNSQGKSTINSCIYYGLCMEELLGGSQNEKALDKSLRTKFTTVSPDTGEELNHNIGFSHIYIEVENSNSDICTIRRIISSPDNKKTKKVVVFESAIRDITSSPKQFPLFIRNRNNNSHDLGFYHWFSEFIGLQMPVVTNISKSGGKSPLYLQTIFSAIFIEQTKGWSEFLASCPYFGIPRNKEKVIEFILDLNELQISSEKDRIQREEKDLKEKWNKSVSKLQLLSSEYGAELQGIPSEIIEDKKLLNTSSIIIINKEDSSKKESIDFLKKKFKKEIEEIKLLPLKKVGENKEAIRVKLEKLYVEQHQFVNKLKEFDTKYNLQKEQRITLHKQLGSVKNELARLKGIDNIIREVLDKGEFYRRCPTCTQDVSEDLMASEGVKIEKLTLEENIKYLEEQKKMLEGATTSLKKILEEKSMVRKYYKKKQREYEEEIKLILEELITDDRAFSEADALMRVRLEKKISDLEFVKTKFDEEVRFLSTLAGEYHELRKTKSNLDSNSQEDKNRLDEFEKKLKDNYLFKFEYDSNRKNNIYINKKEPFKYLPVFKYNQEDKTPKSIRTNSSASDFVRTIWAYSLALLEKGSNHPGVVTFDEPGQHSVKSTSLKAFFEVSSKFKDQQIIMFTSIEKVLSREGEKEKDKLDIDKLLEDLVEQQDYHIYKINDNGKCINILEAL